MSIRDCYENLLIELNKVLAPPLLLKDFIYMFNKGVLQYFNLRYNLFEQNQLLTDDLRVLTRTLYIQNKDYIERTPLPLSYLIPETNASNANIFGVNYNCILPPDYVHMLNCVCHFDSENPSCGSNEGGNTEFYRAATKLNTNLWSYVINNYYLRPSVERPYYYIVNVDTTELDTRNQAHRLDEKNELFDLAVRYGNSVVPKMQIKCGKDPKFNLLGVYIDYLCAPQYLSLDPSQLDTVKDTSQILEFPDYVAYEIINDIVKLLLENEGNQRIQSNMAVNTTIPNLMAQR